MNQGATDQEEWQKDENWVGQNGEKCILAKKIQE